MIGNLVFFFISFAISCTTCYMAAVFKTSSLSDRKMTGFAALCIVVSFWIIMTAAGTVVERELFPAVYVLKEIFLNIIPYFSVWFILHFIEFEAVESRIFKAYLVFMPVLSLAMLFTNQWHNLYLTEYTDPPVVGPMFLVHLALSLCLVIIVYALLFRYIIKNFKKRPLLVLSGIGVAIPVILYVAYLFFPFINFDITPIGYFFTLVLFSYSSYSSRLRKARMGLFSETLAKIAKSPDISTGNLEKVARLISHEGCSALDTYRVGIWRFNENYQLLKCIGCYDSSSQDFTVQADFNLQNHPQYKELMLSERMIVIRDIKTPNPLSDLIDRYGPNICALIEAPIRIGFRLAGILSVEQNYCLSFPEKREWNIEEESFISSLADLAALAITNEERQILKEAESASKAKSQFITNISHEIRTPMNAVLGMVELALRENDIEAKNTHLHTVKQAGIHLMSIINDILDFSKIESGKQEIINEEYLVESLIDEIVNITGMSIADSEVRFAVKADNNIPRVLFGDEAKIRQAIINLLDNSIKFTEKGYISLGVYGEIINNDTMNLIFVVTDTGIGIKQEDINKMFDDFIRLEYENKKIIEGVGLGLAITKNVVEAMGGKINVRSEYGKGSTFSVSLPQKYHTHEPMAVLNKPEEKCVLVFERREAYAESIAFTVKNLGADCVFVTNGTELYEKMENRRFDYLFISFTHYKRNEDTIKKFGANTEAIILTEFNEVISEKNLKTLTMPVYCTVISEILNGIYENITYTTDNAPTVKFTAPDARILLVDDINTNLKVAQGLLTPYNMSIDLCNSGAEAIEAVKSARYDIVFMDHRMPGMDGVETTRRIREWEKEQSNREHSGLSPVPIIALTASAVLGIREMFFKNGFSDYLAKPIDTAALNEILEKWIAKDKQKEIEK